MSAHTFPAGPRRRPDDQFVVEPPPARGDESGLLRHPPSVPVAESYRSNWVRVWPDGPGGRVVDVEPAPGTVSDARLAVFGAEAATVFVVSGQHAFGRPSTRADNAETLRRLIGRLDIQHWVWSPATTFDPGRQWVEEGVVIRGADTDEVCDLARRHGQDLVLRWDADGLAPVVTRAGVELPSNGVPVPVRIAPARTGCPLRGGVDGWCVQQGGPWTSGSITASLVWETHRAMLVDALGCQVCEGGPVTVGAPLGATDLFTPSRRGGWQWGSPRTEAEDIRPGGR